MTEEEAIATIPFKDAIRRHLDGQYSSEQVRKEVQRILIRRYKQGIDETDMDEVQAGLISCNPANSVLR